MNFEDTNLENLKAELREHLTKCVDDREEVWEELCAEQTLCMGIVAKQVLVSDKFSQFHQMWRERDEDEENIEQFHRFMEVEEEVNRLNNSLSAFENKVQKTSDILMELNMRHSEASKDMDQICTLIENSFNLQKLLSIQFPDFLRMKLKSPPYTNPLELNEEWEFLDIDRKITACLAEMEFIIYS